MKDQHDDRDDTPKYLAIGITVMVAAMGFALFYCRVPEGNEQLVIQYMTGLLAVWGIATGFYYNTTKNATKAQDTMNRQAGALAAANAPPSPDKVTLPPGGEVKVEAAPTEEGKP